MSKWVTTWGVPTSFVSESMGNLFDNTTFRNVFYNPLKGEKVRIRFTNKYGNEDVKMECVSIGEWTGKGPNVKKGTLKEIPLDKCGKFINKGGELVTDEIDFTLEPGKNYVVSYYIKELTRLVTGYNKFYGDTYSPNWLSRGDFALSDEFDIKNKLELPNCAFISGVEVLTEDSSSAIMAFGDSITARPWPDLLALRINQEGITNLSVVRKAIGGNRILRDYRDCIIEKKRGIAAIERFEMSVKETLGISKVIMLEGINDILHPHPTNKLCGMDQLPTVDELIEGYKFCCDVAHKYGAKFYLCTLMPTLHTEKHGLNKEEMRLRVNQWIRTNDYIDGYIDFDKTVADENNPAVLKKEYDSGDTLHPSLEGSMALCNAIPKELLI